MIDQWLRIPKDRLLTPIALKLHPAITPLALTGAAFGVGLAASIAVWQGAYGPGLGLWIANRALDGLDGTLARVRQRQTDFGGYLDLVLDTVIYALIPGALIAADPSLPGLAALAFLLASFYINGASWMLLAAVLEKRSRGAAMRGETTTVTMPGGLIEGAETVLFYVLFLLVPDLAVELFVLMGALVFMTIGQRLIWAVRELAHDSPRAITGD